MRACVRACVRVCVRERVGERMYMTGGVVVCANACSYG